MPTTLPGVEPHQAPRDCAGRTGRSPASARSARVFGKVGRADTATDPAPISMIETTIHLLPRADWPLRRAPALVQRLGAGAGARRAGAAVARGGARRRPRADRRRSTARRACRAGAGAWTAPVRARIDMMSTGVRTPVGVRVVAPRRPERLEALGAAAAAAWWPPCRGRAAPCSRRWAASRGWSSASTRPRSRARRSTRRWRARSPIISGARRDRRPRPMRSPTGRRRPPVRVRVMPDENVQGPADQLRDATVRSRRARRSPAGAAGAGRPRRATRPGRR